MWIIFAVKHHFDAIFGQKLYKNKDKILQQERKQLKTDFDTLSSKEPK